MRVVLLIGLIVVCCGCLRAYERGDSDIYNIRIGQQFSVVLPENGSTGSSNCWLNEVQCNHIELVERKYEGSEREREGFVGAGGTVIWSFKGVTNGTDTIKIKNCLTGVYNRPCSFFRDSVMINEDGQKKVAIAQRFSEWDYTFVVHVRD